MTVQHPKAPQNDWSINATRLLNSICIFNTESQYLEQAASASQTTFNSARMVLQRTNQITSSLATVSCAYLASFNLSLSEVATS